MRALWSLVAIGALAACSRPSATTAPTDAPVPSASARATPGDAGARATDAGKDTGRSIGPAERSTYASALGEGRKRTREGKYPEAIAAFTRGLDAIPGDARALAERGYARLLGKDLDRAGEDFSFALAASDPRDRKLRAQIEFNLGLVSSARAERPGNQTEKEVATGHFRRSYELSPTPAAKSKMVGCPVASAPATTTLFASMSDARKAYTTADDNFTDSSPPGVFTHQKDDDNAEVFLPLDGGRVARIAVGSLALWHCGTLGEIEVTREGDVWKVVYQAHHGVMGGGVCTCDDVVCNGGSAEDSQAPPCKCDAPFCPLSCGPANDPEGAHSETYVDARTGAGLWSFELDHDYLDDVKLEADPAARHFGVSGLDCGAH